MTAISDRPQMLPEEFEELARLAARTAEGVRLEFINGKLGASRRRTATMAAPSSG